MEFNPKFDRKVLKAFSQRIAQNALEHQDQYAVRTGTILAAKGLIKGVHHEHAAPELQALIENADHPDRVPTPEGPLLFCRSPSGSMSITCVEVSELILHPEQPIRFGAVQYFQRLTVGLLCGRTVHMLEQSAADVPTAEDSVWQMSAVRLYDALEDDHLLILAGIRQSLSLGYDEMIRKFMARALSPSILSVDALASEIMVVSDHAPEVAKRIEEITQSSESISNLCSAYFKAFGHVPLAKTLSLAHAVSMWQQSHPTTITSEWWQQVWSWVESTGNPVARYHGLSLFTQRPDLIPAESRDDFRIDLLAFLESPMEESPDSTAWVTALAFRNETAVHYHNYLNCRMAPSSPNVLGEWVWWMTEQFCSCFGPDARLLTRVLVAGLRPASRNSVYEFALTPARSESSNLCYATLFVDHLWSLALLANISGEFMAASAPTFSEAEVERFIKQLSRHLATAPPILTNKATGAIYAADEPLTGAMRTWCAASQQAAVSTMMQTFVSSADERFDPDNLLKRLKQLLSLSRDEQLYVVLTLRMMIAAGLAPSTALLAMVSDFEWLNDALKHLDQEVCERLLSAFCTVPQRAHDSWLGWFFQLSVVCDQPSLNAERRSLIFEFIVLGCALSDSSGPVLRLLNGAHRNLFSHDASLCRSKFEAAYPVCSQAVKSTIRSITSALYLT